MAALQNGTDRSDEGYKLTEEEGKILYDVFISQEWPEAVSVLVKKVFQSAACRGIYVQGTPGIIYKFTPRARKNNQAS